MLVEALVGQFEQRFDHEKRARVCLWFDEHREFTRLLPHLRDYVGALTSPPFALLEYDEAARHGQIWLKSRVAQALRAADGAAAPRPRCVIYVPHAEDRIERPGPNGEPPLELLMEYAVAGVVWRIGGKRPTLFSFMKQAGVALPVDPTAQRRLYEGGADSLLAKYAAGNADQPDSFWQTRLTPELVQSRLIGDLDQTVFDLARDPDGAWEDLTRRGLASELQALVQERYGLELPMEPVNEWVLELVTLVALTDAYAGYGEPADFPFLDRLPASALRAHHSQLLKRWLRDADSRSAWDRWVGEAETRIDLSAWAEGREGSAFGFPHLVWLRWDRLLAEFEDASQKVSATAEFFARNKELIASEAELGVASSSSIGHWSLMRDLGRLLDECEAAAKRMNASQSVLELAQLYVEMAARTDLAHMRVRLAAEERDLLAVAHVADRAYAGYTNALNASFFAALVDEGTGLISGLPHVTQQVEEEVWSGSAQRAVVIVDALRYDCACAIKDQLHDRQVTIEPVAASLPTVTPVGMTALLPLHPAAVSLDIVGNDMRPKVDGKDLSVSANRMDVLQRHGAICIAIREVESADGPPPDMGDLLVVYGHDDLDHIGHSEALTLIRHVQTEIDRLARLIQKLHRWGFPTVHVITDHGFILLPRDLLPDTVPCDPSWCHVLKERYAIVPASADVPVATFPFAWDADVRVCVPPGLAFFKAEKSFSHGGAAVQEMVIPHLTSCSRRHADKRIGVDVVVPVTELTRAAVKVTLRPRTPESTPAGQMVLATDLGRALELDVFRATDELTGPVSVLASGARRVRIEAGGDEQSLTLFFHSAIALRAGETLELDVRDAETGEQFPAGGLKLTVLRDM